VPFIPPMLCTRLGNPARLTDPRYVAEPKLDGQRAQLHVREGRTAYLFSRPGRDLLRHPGMAWLR
jgi:ATP-dependent DNA ligase